MTSPLNTDGAAASLDEDELLSAFASIPSANIGDGMDRLGLLDAAIKPVWPGAHIVGRAFTCWTRPGDNLWLHKALEQASPGDVIVVNGGADETRALLGELIGVRARTKGIAGFVVDGSVRDAEGLAEYGMPVFARAITPAGPYKDGPGKLSIPIAVGGVSVAPGDIIVGDADGVAVVPTDQAADILAAAKAVQQNEDNRRAGYEADLKAALAERESS